MTFDTLAMDLNLRKELLEDLDKFMNGKEYYKKVGKAWKRGYFLYGPPGTGKSSLIAAMANHLKFDIYDLDLTNIDSNNELIDILLRMPGRSILVIEDIDCLIKPQNRSRRVQPFTQDKDKIYVNLYFVISTLVTLSGLLNYIDGIFSCFGEGRIIIFTTNYKERLDPALLRPGRMDIHIFMSFCNPNVFKQLAYNYLGLQHHNLHGEIESLIKEIEVTPAEVAGELMKSTDADISLQGLLNFLYNKRIEQDKSSK
ncbi:Spastin [Parasponia andersonii]|uniref:Spastin n=1 Tax=Parasponia andersonii TaxID=3476 RepID=A0A2P5DYY9_PARAD|nr:Spastin [Parasponia andersonii]